MAMDTISSETNVMAMDTISIETKFMAIDASPISVQIEPEGARIEEEDINSETSAEVKQADEGAKDESIGDNHVVESILDHRLDFPDGNPRYLVHWKGHDASEQSWEVEDKFGDSRDVLNAYWELIGGNPLHKKRRGRPPGKKRGRKVSVKAADDGSGEWVPPKQSAGHWDAVMEVGETMDGPVPKKRRGRPPGRNGGNQVSDEAAVVEWAPPTPSDGNWDDLVQAVETLEKDDKGALWSYLLWKEKKNDGGPLRNKVLVEISYMACPQKMLDFYEGHIVFSAKKKSRPMPSSALQRQQDTVVNPKEGVEEDENEDLAEYTNGGLGEDTNEGVKEDENEDLAEYTNGGLGEYTNEGVEEDENEDLAEYTNGGLGEDTNEVLAEDTNEGLGEDSQEYTNEGLGEYSNEDLVEDTNEGLGEDFEEDLGEDFEEDLAIEGTNEVLAEDADESV